MEAGRERGRLPRVLVTGASGGVGRAVVHEFSSQGWSVVPVARHRGEVDGQTILDIDLTSTEASLPDDLEVDAVVHLAAVIPAATVSAIRPATEENLTMVRWALGLAQRHAVPLALASSAFIHDPILPPPYTEDSPIRCTTPYHEGKVVAEELCERHLRITGLPATWLRISSPYGPGMRHRTVLTTFIQAAAEGTNLSHHGTGARSQDFVHVRDVAVAFRRAIEQRASGPYLIASGASVSMVDLAERIVALASPTRSRVVPSGKPDPQEDCRWQFDCSKARDELGFEPAVSLEAGLAELVASRSPV